MADLADQTLDLLAQFESQRKNIRNREYSETSSPPRTAQGYWQITNDNWNTYGPKVGIDTKKYPNAMSMEEPDQRKVARYLLLNTDNGIKNWLAASDPKFLEQMEKLIPQDSTSDLKVVQPPPRKRESLKGGPSSLADWATSPDPQTTFGIDPSSPGGYVTPGLKQMARGAFGYGSSEGKGFAPRAHEFIEGAKKEAVPASIGATLGLTGGALATGSGVIRSLLPLILGGAGSETLGTMSRSAAPEITKDPDWQNLIGDTGDIAGAYLGGKYGPELLRSPWGRAGIGALIGHHAGLPPYVGEILGGIIGGGGEYMPGKPGEFMRGLRGTATVKAAPADKVAAPKVDIPKREASVEMYRNGAIDDQGFLEHEKLRGSDPKIAQQHLDNAKATIHQEALEEKVTREQQAAEAQEKTAKDAEALRKSRIAEAQKMEDRARKQQAQREKAEIDRKKRLQEQYDRDNKRILEQEKMKRDAEKLARERQEEEEARRYPKMRPSADVSQTSPWTGTSPNIGPVKVNLMPGLTIESAPTGSGAPQGNVAPPQGGNVLGPGGASMSGTTGLGIPTGKVDIPPTATPPMSGTPVNTQLGSGLPGFAPKPTGTVNVPSANITGAAPQVKPGVPEAGTPLGNMPKIVPKSLEGRAAAVADEAEASNSTPPITSNDAVLRGWSKRVGFPVTKDVMTKAREVLTSRGIAKKKRP